MSTKCSRKIIAEVFSGYYGNYNMGGGAGPGGGGSWYRGTGGGAQSGAAGAGWVGGAWGYTGGPGAGPSGGEQRPALSEISFICVLSFSCILW